MTFPLISAGSHGKTDGKLDKLHLHSHGFHHHWGFLSHPLPHHLPAALLAIIVHIFFCIDVHFGKGGVGWVMTMYGWMGTVRPPPLMMGLLAAIAGEEPCPDAGWLTPIWRGEGASQTTMEHGYIGSGIGIGSGSGIGSGNIGSFCGGNKETVINFFVVVSTSHITRSRY